MGPGGGSPRRRNHDLHGHPLREDGRRRLDHGQPARDAPRERRNVPPVTAGRPTMSPTAIETTLTEARIQESLAKGLWRNETLEAYLDRWATSRPDKTALVDPAGR